MSRWVILYGEPLLAGGIALVVVVVAFLLATLV